MRSATKKRTGKDPDYLDWIRTLPCVCCVGLERFLRLVAGTQTWLDVAKLIENQRYPTEAAHVGQRGLSQKCPDRQAIPLCELHHTRGRESHHRLQKKFWSFWFIDRDALIAELNSRFKEEHGNDAGTRTINTD